MATDYAENGFPFTDLRVEEAAEYCRRHGIARREWRDTSTGTDGAASGLTLVCGARTATFYVRFRRDGTRALDKLKAVGLVWVVSLSRHKGAASVYGLHPHPDRCLQRCMDAARPRKPR